MNLDFGLQLRQEQKLIMTQELQLSVKILQLTTYELQEYIEEQLLENPLLEYGEKLVSNERKSEGSEDGGSDEYDSGKSEQEDRENPYDLIERIISDSDSSFDEDKYYNGEDEDVSPLNFVSKEVNLWEFLKEQLNLMPTSQRTTRMCEYIIDNIDENGYLTVDTDNISKWGKCSTEDAENMIALVQTFEPAGICCRNIQECLLLQLKSRNICNDVLENIINNMLVDVGYGKISKIAKENGISESQAQEYVDIIRRLDPKPGIRYCCETTRYVVPDVFVEKINGEYIVNVNEEGIPALKINRTYRNLLANKNAPEYKYVKEKLQAALWIIKSIEQRIGTIKRVVEAIISYQLDFFENDTDLKPLTLKQIASEIDMHESTVSRAVNGKYAQTPKGVFELKNFFMRGVQNKTGEDISTLKIKNSIRDIIGTEDPKKPLSDQQISELLDGHGMNISRRTVAKYREEINIPSSSKRKK